MPLAYVRHDPLVCEICTTIRNDFKLSPFLLLVKSSSRRSKDERLPSYLMTCLFGIWYLVLGESTISQKKKDKQHNTELLVGMVRQQFKKQMDETDPDKIQKLKDDAARGLINHMLHESEKMTGRKFSQNC